jgi:hypothetical protein
MDSYLGPLFCSTGLHICFEAASLEGVLELQKKTVLYTLVSFYRFVTNLWFILPSRKPSFKINKLFQKKKSG